MSVVDEEVIEIFTENLHKKLKKRINTRIYVNVDVEKQLLYVRCYKIGVSWTFTKPDIFTQIIYGNVDNLVDEIVKGFKKEVHRLFFY